MFVGLTVDAGYHHAVVDVVERLSQVDSLNGYVGTAFPRSQFRTERYHFRIRAGLAPVQPHRRTALALVLHFAPVRTLAPAAIVFGGQGQAHAAIVGHVATAVNDDCKKEKIYTKQYFTGPLTSSNI